MKTLETNLYPFLVLLAFIIISGCAGTKNASTSSQDNKPKVVDTGYSIELAKDVDEPNETLAPNEKAPSNLTLADMLRQVSGVSVMGQGSNVRIRVHGVSSFGPTDPLYVLDGNVIGTNYVQVAGMVNPNDITTLRALKGPEATIYGTRAGNGVILIRTKVK